MHRIRALHLGAAALGFAALLILAPGRLAGQQAVGVPIDNDDIGGVVRGDVFYWGPLMAGALLGSIPVALVYSFFVEHYVTALTGAVKG